MVKFDALRHNASKGKQGLRKDGSLEDIDDIMLMKA